jgi:hypothetical protein
LENLSPRDYEKYDKYSVNNKYYYNIDNQSNFYINNENGDVISKFKVKPSSCLGSDNDGNVYLLYDTRKTRDDDVKKQCVIYKYSLSGKQEEEIITPFVNWPWATTGKEIFVKETGEIFFLETEARGLVICKYLLK